MAFDLVYVSAGLMACIDQGLLYLMCEISEITEAVSKNETEESEMTEAASKNETEESEMTEAASKSGAEV